MVLVRMVPVLVRARKRTFSLTKTTINNTICYFSFLHKYKRSDIGNFLNKKNQKYRNRRICQKKHKVARAASAAGCNLCIIIAWKLKS